MVVLKSGWNMESDGFVDGDYIVTKNLRIPISEVLLFTVEGTEEIVWASDIVSVASPKSWCYLVYSYWHTVFSAIIGKQK